MEEELVVGEIWEKMDREAFNFKEIVWEIGEASLTDGRKEGRSPEFSFAVGSWYLRFEAYYRHMKLDSFILYLCMIRRLEKKQEVFTKSYVKYASGQKLGNDMIRHRYTDTNYKKCLLYVSRVKQIAVAPNDKLVVDFQIFTKGTAVQSTSQEDVPRPVTSQFAERTGCRWLNVKEIIWNIPGIWRTQRSFTAKRRSHNFSFANNTWILYIDEHKDIYGLISICCNLRRLQAADVEQEMFFIVSLKDSDHKNLLNQEKCFFFGSQEDDVLHSIRPRRLGRRNGSLIVVCRIYSMCAVMESDPQEKCLCPVRSSATEGGQLSKVLLDFEKLLLSRENCDVTLQVRGHKFEAHRAFIGARSPVFAAMLSHDMKERNTGLIDIEDCDPEHFPDFLRFLYCGNVQIITSQNACSLFRAADKYDVQDLKSECLKFMKSHLDVENFCDVIALALQYDDAALVKHATDFFVKNSPTIVKTVKWQVFLDENTTQENELIMKALSRRTNP